MKDKSRGLYIKLIVMTISWSKWCIIGQMDLNRGTSNGFTYGILYVQNPGSMTLKGMTFGEVVTSSVLQVATVLLLCSRDLHFQWSVTVSQPSFHNLSLPPHLAAAISYLLRRKGRFPMIPASARFPQGNTVGKPAG